MGNLAATLRAEHDLARRAEASGAGGRGTQAPLGTDHQDTAAPAKSLAATLRVQGDLRGADALQQDVLDVRKQSYREPPCWLSNPRPRVIAEVAFAMAACDVWDKLTFDAR